MNDTTRSTILALAAQSPPARPPDVDLALRRGMRTLQLRLLGCYLGAVALTAGVLVVGTALTTVARQAAAEPLPALRSVKMVPDAVVLSPGDVQQLSLRAVAIDGTVSDVDDGVAWRSADPAVVDVAPGSGRATAGSPGTTTITATHRGRSATTAVTVLDPEVTVTSVEVTPGSLALAVGDTEQLTATAAYSDGTTGTVDEGVEWRSSNTEVARVDDAPGQLGARAPGAATVTATFRGRTGSASVRVLEPITTLTTLVLIGGDVVLAAGESRPLAARATFSDGTSAEVLSGVTWRSSDHDVARFEGGAGVLRAVAPGTASLTASYGGRMATARVTVPGPAVPESIAVAPPAATLVPGDALQLAVTLSLSDGSTTDVRDDVDWQVDGLKVVQVEGSGRAIAVGPGTAVVTASHRGLTARAVVTVDRPLALTSVAVTPSATTLSPGDTVQLGVTATFSDGSTSDVRDGVVWRSDSPEVADVDSTSGRATGAGAGTATLTAAYRGMTAAAAITVRAPVTATSLTVSPPDADLDPHEDLQLVATVTFSDSTSTDIREGVAWRTNNRDVVELDPTSGLARANGPGRATLTAAYQGLTAQSVVAVRSPSGDRRHDGSPRDSTSRSPRGGTHGRPAPVRPARRAHDGFAGRASQQPSAQPSGPPPS